MRIFMVDNVYRMLLTFDASAHYLVLAHGEFLMLLQHHLLFTIEVVQTELSYLLT